MKGQGSLQQDSIYIDRGVDQTTQYEPSSRVYFEAYADNGRPAEIVTTRPTPSGEWRFHQRRLMTYAGDRLATLRLQSWSQDKQLWVDFSERQIAYDDEDNLLGETLLQAPGAGMPLENARRKTYDYAETGELIQVLAQRWRNMNWEDMWRQNLTYNEMGDILTRELQQWSATGWKGLLRRQWTYDPDNGNATEIVTQRWSAQLDQWENRRRRALGYNAGGLWVGSLYQVWNAEEQVWENESREIHNLNNRNKLDNFVYQVWREGAWLNGSRELTYSEELSFGSIVQQWDTLAGGWDNRFRYQTTLNDQTVLDEVLEKQVWSPEGETWINDGETRRLTYFWSDVSVSAGEAALPDLNCLIPNPYWPGAAIHCPELPLNAEFTLDLYDLTGKRLTSQRLYSGAALTLPGNISPGAYLVQIRQDQRIRLVEKLIVIR